MDVFGNDTETAVMNPQVAALEAKVRELKEEDWSEKYRPPTIDDILLPTYTKNLIKNSLEQGVQNMTFYSTSPGTGKTTTAMVIPAMMGCQFRYFNASIDGRIAVVKSDITNYAMQKGLDGRPKIVILEEVDGASEEFFNALRSVMDWSKDTLRFILTCNRIDKIPEPILSRCTPISFNKTTDAEEEKNLKNSIFKKLKKIAVTETGNESKVDKKTIVELVNSYYPDVRKMVRSLQLNFLSNNGTIQGGIVTLSDSSVEKIWNLLKQDKWEEARKLYIETISDHTGFYDKFLDHALKVAPNNIKMSIGSVVAEFLYRSTAQVNQETIMTCGFFPAIVKILKM